MKKTDELILQIRAARLPPPQREYRFHPTRRWRFDFCWPKKYIACEFEGGVYTHGRHTRGKGFENDCEKYNEAALYGWKVIRVTANMVRSGLAIEQLTRALKKQ